MWRLAALCRGIICESYVVALLDPTIFIAAAIALFSVMLLGCVHAPAPAALSSAVTQKPVGVDILGTRLTLFRDETGAVVAVDDACPHRGAPLSAGWTATDKTSGKK